MSAQFHTPSFGDEVFDLTEANNFVQPQQQQQQQQSKRMRSMDGSFDEYHSANDESFGNAATLINSSPPTIPANTTASDTLSKETTMPIISEPTKPLSAYALFFRDTVSAIKQQNPHCSFNDLSRIVASMWDSLGQAHKNVYNSKNEIARNEYLALMEDYHQQMQLQKMSDLSSSHVGNNGLLQTKPAVFTIPRQSSTDSFASHESNFITNSPTFQPQLQQLSNFNDVTEQQHSYMNVPAIAMENNNNNSLIDTPPLNANDPSPSQIQMITEAGSVQKCTRENCNKRAIINPDWEDEYCSNECVVIHCRNVFNKWIESNLDAKKGQLSIC